MALGFASACTDGPQAPCDECAIVDDNFQSPGAGGSDGSGGGSIGDPLDVPPDTLLATGLCADEACTAIRPGVAAFQPRWTLWTDGATKRRWIYLPPGTTIDTTQPDYWRFPVGTKLWKEFTRDGVRVETRYMVKFGPADDDWLFMPYAWNDDESLATPAPEGRADPHGTAHDIPPGGHVPQVPCERPQSRARLQRAAARLRSARRHDDLDDALASGWLSAPCGNASSPHFPLPGDAPTQAVLGYLHANCGHCHNSQSPLVNRPSFRLETDHLATVADTRTYRTTVDVSGIPYGGATIIAKPGDPKTFDHHHADALDGSEEEDAVARHGNARPNWLRRDPRMDHQPLSCGMLAACAAFSS